MLPNEQATVALGAKILESLSADRGAIIYLIGDLGAGKTTLTRGVLHALGHSGAVKSPTYTLVEPYEMPGRNIYHFDLYRLADPEELEYVGIRDYFDGKSLCLIEWPSRGEGVLPPADLIVKVSVSPGEASSLGSLPGRRARLLAQSEVGEAIIQGCREFAPQS
ncbi:tRNA (adenosine(37)-N6)-threonylcarbamoyltransferase complex ATPase subunit type 1 TsaE [Aurantivibrio plasticivorans]